MENVKQKLLELGVPKELLENPAVVEKFKNELEDTREKGDLVFEKTEYGYRFGKYIDNNWTRFVEFSKDCCKLNASYVTYSTGNNFSEVRESTSFNENGILLSTSSSWTSYGALDGGVAGTDTYEVDVQGRIIELSDSSYPKSYIDFGFISSHDIFEYGVMTGKSSFNDKALTLNDVMEKFELYSNLVVSKYPDLKEFYEGKRAEVINVIIEDSLTNPNSLIKATDEELKSVGVLERELALRQQLIDKQEKIDTLEELMKNLQTRLRKTLIFAEEVKKSSFGKIFFRKQLSMLPNDKEER